MPVPKTKFLILAGVIAACAAAVLLQEQANARLRAQIEDLRKEIAHASTSLEKAGVSLAQAKASLEKENQLAQIEAQPSPDFPHSVNYKKMEVRFQGELADNYAYLFRKLKLSPDKLALFEKLLVQKQITETAVAHYLAGGQFPGLDPNDLDALKTLERVGTEDINNQIQQVLGSQLYDQYEHYDTTLNSRKQINAFETGLRYTNTPLNDTQVDQLVELLAQANPDPTLPLPDSFQTQAAAILEPDQLPALKNLTTVLQARRTIQAMNQAALSKGIVRPTALTGADLLFNLQR